MIPRWILIGVFIIVVSLGVLLSVGEYSFSDDSLLTFEKTYTWIFPSNYSINSKCELYNLFIENSKKHDSLESAWQAFVGYTSEDIGSIIAQVNEKFYGDAYDEDVRKNPGGLAPGVDQGIYQQEITKTSLTLFTDKAMITNDINPKLKNDVRELLNLMATHNFEPIREAIDVC